MAVKMTVPQVGESISEVTLSSWLKSDGDYVERDEIICEIESEKASFEISAESSGVLKVLAKEGETLSIGGAICEIDTDAQAPEGKKAEKQKEKDGSKEASTQKSAESPSSSAQPTKEKAAATQGTADVFASPLAAEILKDHGLSPEQVKGTGSNGKITKADALKAVESKASGSGAGEPKTAPAPQGQRSQERKKLSSLRKTLARRLVEVKNQTAMLTTFNEVDMKPIMDLRSRWKEPFQEKFGVKLGFMGFFTKAVCRALLEYPQVNSQIEGDELLMFNYCDISIAVSTPKGLVVPVIRSAHEMSIAQIEQEIGRLADRAREGKVSMEEMTGGTFTITNGGVFGSMLSTPILNPPQSAILGMHNIVERPVAVKGKVEVRPVMFVALSYDHRVIDGRESVGFLVRVKEQLENPESLLLSL